MKKNSSLVVMILDRSGSMSSIKEATETGYLEFINKQKSDPGECYVSLYQFDDVYDVIYENRNIQEVDGKYTLYPRNMTALLDAMGRTINRVGERLNNTPEYDRPETVIVCVLTDGLENASKEFTNNKIKEMVKHQRDRYNWKFIFLGANQDAILTGISYGFSQGLSVNYNASAGSTVAAFAAASSGISCLKTVADYQFSDEIRCSVLNS